MSLGNITGTPLMAAIIVLLAVIAIGSLSFGFSGSVQF